jgi:hypothetical protein
MEKETAVEKISGSPLTSVAATIVAAAGAASAPYFLAPLLPVLARIPAAIRHKKRIEQAIQHVEEDLSQQKEHLQNLTDGQYEFVVATITALFSTVDQEKIELLRVAIRNGLTEPFENYEAQFLARVIREISPREATFLCEAIKFHVIHIGHQASGSSAFNVLPNSPEKILVNGLLSLGLLSPSDAVYLEVSSYEFSPMAKKIVALLST